MRDVRSWWGCGIIHRALSNRLSVPGALDFKGLPLCDHRNTCPFATGALVRLETLGAMKTLALSLIGLVAFSVTPEAFSRDGHHEGRRGEVIVISETAIVTIITMIAEGGRWSLSNVTVTGIIGIMIAAGRLAR